MRKILFFVVAMIMLAVPVIHSAEKFEVSVSQIVEHPSLDAMRKGFMDRLKERDIDVKYNVHIAQGNPATNAQIASQILGEKPDLVLAVTTPSSQACAQKIKDIPIVFTGVTDPLSAGLVKSMDKPGANVTGMTDLSPVNRQVALIKEILPQMKRLGVLYNPGEPNSVFLVGLLKKTCQASGLELVEATAVNSGAVLQAARSLPGRCDAVYVPVDNTVVSALESAIKVCAETKLPLFSADTDSVARGTVAALAVDYYKMGLQTGDMAVRILKKQSAPASMPVESLADLELHVNRKAAAAMGVTIPAGVLARAAKVLE